MITKLFDAWLVTANRFGEEDGYVYEGDMVVGDPMGRLQRTAVGKEQFMVAELYFLSNGSAITKLLRRIWVGFSFLPYLVRNFGVLLRSIKQ